MGLLEKAILILEGKYPSFTLDKKGAALRNRIKKLYRNKAPVYTALGLITAYGGCYAGICLSRFDNNYSSYSSIGVGLGRVSIHEEGIFSHSEASKKYFKLNTRAMHLGINDLDPALDLWIFPLDKKTPWDNVLLLAASELSAFNPIKISLLLSDVLDIMNPHKYPLEAALLSFHEVNPLFSGILIKFKKSSAKEKKEYSEKLGAMFSEFGKVIPMSEKRTGKNLVLIPQSMDRELITHRLTASIPVDIHFGFDAGSPAEALDKLKSFI